MTLHDDEVPAGPDLARRLIAAQRPDLGGCSIEPVGAGTDNTMYRVGQGLLMRLPRTRETERSLRTELTWLPRLRRSLTWPVPEPLFTGSPSDDFPLVWALYRWIDGEPASTATVTDWAAYGRDLASFVNRLHSLDRFGQTRQGDLESYRGGPLTPHDGAVAERLRQIRALPADVPVDRLEQVWRAALALPPPTGGHVWLHGDLRPSNVLVRDGRICAVIDFGGLSIGFADAEHAPVWDLPAAARLAYREAQGIDDTAWLRARGWALLVGVLGVPYYWTSYPTFAAECVRRLQRIAAEAP